MDERIQSGCCSWCDEPSPMGFRGGRVPASCPPGFQGRYTVVPGDTMFFIAQRFGVSLNALIAANPQITNPNEIFPGDVLCVPGMGMPPTGRVPASCPPGFQGRYTVVPGDTMFFIARRFGVSLNALIAANPHITNPNEIFPGDVLCVPGAQACRIPASCPPGFQCRYTVQPGDTMFLIAQRFGVSLNALIAANPQITNPAEIFPCDVLCVPCEPECRMPASCPPGFRCRYTVQPGDTMFTIAQRFGVNVNALIAANPQITNPNEIFPCDVLCVPCEPECRVPASCPPGFRCRYTVQPGDSMFSIAQRFGVSLNALIAANPQITNPAEIFPCDVLCVPCLEECREPKHCPKGFQGRYTVQAGDTMFTIAQRFKVSVHELIEANPHIENPMKIFPCDVLCVPKHHKREDGEIVLEQEEEE
jgi:LysM repeat protein